MLQIIPVLRFVLLAASRCCGVVGNFRLSRFSCDPIVVLCAPWTVSAAFWTHSAPRVALAFVSSPVYSVEPSFRRLSQNCLIFVGERISRLSLRRFRVLRDVTPCCSNHEPLETSGNSSRSLDRSPEEAWASSGGLQTELEEVEPRSDTLFLTFSLFLHIVFLMTSFSTSSVFLFL